MPEPRNDRPRATVAEAVAAWEAKGPTSLTIALVVDALYGVRERIEALHVEAYPGAGWCAGCHDAGKADTYPCSTRDAMTCPLPPAETEEPDCACGHAEADHVFTGGGFCNECGCERYVLPPGSGDPQ